MRNTSTRQILEIIHRCSFSKQFTRGCRCSFLRQFTRDCRVTTRGLLTGKVRRGVQPTEGRLAKVVQGVVTVSEAAPHWTSFDEKTFNIIDTLEAIAQSRGRSIPQVAVRWLLQKDVVSSVVIGARTVPQLEDNMGAASGWSLTREEMHQLDEVSAPALPYPYTFYSLNADRVNRAANNFYVTSTSN